MCNKLWRCEVWLLWKPWGDLKDSIQQPYGKHWHMWQRHCEGLRISFIRKQMEELQVWRQTLTQKSAVCNLRKWSQQVWHLNFWQREIWGPVLLSLKWNWFVGSFQDFWPSTLELLMKKKWARKAQWFSSKLLYLSARSNCVASSSLYKICCINQFKDLLSNLKNGESASNSVREANVPMQLSVQDCLTDAIQEC